MRTAFAIPAFCMVLVVPALTGCSSPMVSTAAACTASPFISPQTATLDDTATAPANAVQFTTGDTYPAGCAYTNVIPLYYWTVSDAVDAAVTSPGGKATCLSAAPAPITVSSTLASYNASSGTTVYVPSGLPSATLICK